MDDFQDVGSFKTMTNRNILPIVEPAVVNSGVVVDDSGDAEDENKLMLFIHKHEYFGKLTNTMSNIHY